MKSKPARIRGVIHVMLAAIFLAALPGIQENAFADRRGRGRADTVVIPANRHGPDARGRHPVHHRREVHHSRGWGGLVMIPPHFGAVVASLPFGFMTVMLGGMTYYCHNNIYYQRVPAGYVVVEPPPTVVVRAQPLRETVVVTTWMLNVRSGPGMNFSVIHQAANGEQLPVHGRSPGWIYVQTASGEFGWVMTQFTSPGPGANG